MKRYGLLTLIVGTGMAVLSSCDDQFEGTTFVTPTTLEEEMSCTTIFENRSDTFSLWIDLLKYTDYYNALNDAGATATVFAPTNSAMKDFLDWQGVSSIDELDKTYATYVVQTHIINGTKVNSETFVSSAEDGSALTNMTLFNAYLTPSFGYTISDVDDAERNDSVILDSEYIFINNQAEVAPKDGGGIRYVEAANGIIYYMNNVIHPLAETMIDKLEKEGEYSIFVEAARQSGYDDVVSVVRDTVKIAGGGYTVTTYNFTCFAPCDAAFNQAGISNVSDLQSALKAVNPNDNTDSLLYNYVAYHFLDQSYTKANFFSFDSDDQTLIYDTKLKYQVITCKKDTINNVSYINDAAKILRSNIEARNGIIHKIDYYLPIREPEPVEVKWDFCNSSDIISFVNAYGAYKGIGDLFSTALASKEYQVDLSEDCRDGEFGTISNFTYMANTTKASTSSYRRIGFKKCKYIKSTDKTHNAYDAYMNNLLILNLGYAGWIQFETPTIIKGKYKVTLHYASEATMKAFHSAGSLTKFEIDAGEEDAYSKNAYMFKGLPTTSYTYGNADLELWDKVEFETSGTHTFKGTMLDINAKTNGSYHQLWDYVLFTPIND